MKFKAYTGITWSELELTGLFEDEDSRVYCEKFRKHLGLHPFHLTNLNAALNEILSSNLNSYDLELKGFLLAYKNPKILTPLGEIVYDTCFIHVDIEADFYVFRPEVGCSVKGVVNKKGLDHIGVLVHKAFNVSIPKPDSEDEWPGDNIEIGQEVRFEITLLDISSKLPDIRGMLNSDDYLQGCKLLVNNKETLNKTFDNSSQNSEENEMNTVSKSNTTTKTQMFFTTDTESSSDEEAGPVKKEISQQKKSKKKSEKYELMKHNDSENENEIENGNAYEYESENEFESKHVNIHENENKRKYIDSDNEKQQENHVKNSKETKVLKSEFDKTETMKEYTDDTSMNSEMNYEAGVPDTLKKHTRKKDKHRRSSTNTDEFSNGTSEKYVPSTGSELVVKNEVTPKKSSKKKKLINDSDNSEPDLNTEKHVKSQRQKNTKKNKALDEPAFIDTKSERINNSYEVNDDAQVCSMKKKPKTCIKSDISESDVDIKDVENITLIQRLKGYSTFDNVNVKAEETSSGSEKTQEKNTVKRSKQSKKHCDLSTFTHSCQTTVEKNKANDTDTTTLDPMSQKKHLKKLNELGSELVIENVKVETEIATSSVESNETENYVKPKKKSKKRSEVNSMYSFGDNVEDNKKSKDVDNNRKIEKTSSKKRIRESSESNGEETPQSTKVKREILNSDLENSQREDDVKPKKKLKKNSEINASTSSLQHEIVNDNENISSKKRSKKFDVSDTEFTEQDHVKQSKKSKKSSKLNVSESSSLLDSKENQTDSRNVEPTPRKKRQKKSTVSNTAFTLQNTVVETEVPSNNDFNNIQEEEHVKQSKKSKKSSKSNVPESGPKLDLEKHETNSRNVELTPHKKRSKKSDISDSEFPFQNVKVKKELITSCSEDTDMESRIKSNKKSKKDSELNVSTSSSQHDVEDNEIEKKKKNRSSKSILDTIKVEPVFEDIIIKQEKLDSEVENICGENGTQNMLDTRTPKKRKRKSIPENNVNNGETDIQSNVNHIKRSKSMDNESETHTVKVKMEKATVNENTGNEMKPGSNNACADRVQVDLNQQSDNKKENKRTPSKKTSYSRNSEIALDFNTLKIKVEKSPDS